MECNAHMHVEAVLDMQFCLLLSLSESDTAQLAVTTVLLHTIPVFMLVFCWQESLYTCCKHQMVQRGSPHCPLWTCLLATQELA